MNNNIKITVAETGYVGLSTAIPFSQRHQVTAVEVIPEKVDLINQEESPIQNAEYFFQKLDGNLNKTWESGVLSQERLDKLRKVDVRKYLRNRPK